MEKCKICGKKFVNKAGLGCHKMFCPSKLDKKRIAVQGGKLVCEFGCGRTAWYVLKMGKACCEKDAKSCPEMRWKVSQAKKGRCPKWKNGHPRGFSGKTPWNKGLGWG